MVAIYCVLDHGNRVRNFSLDMRIWTTAVRQKYERIRCEYAVSQNIWLFTTVLPEYITVYVAKNIACGHYRICYRVKEVMWTLCGMFSCDTMWTLCGDYVQHVYVACDFVSIILWFDWFPQYCNLDLTFTWLEGRITVLGMIKDCYDCSDYWWIQYCMECRMLDRRWGDESRPRVAL